MASVTTELPTGTVDEVASGLLGWLLTTVIDGVTTGVVLTEVEAYGGADDPASHAFTGRTERNAAMFERPGTLYTYLSYGIHTCANVAVGPEGRPGAVLLRGGVPFVGRTVMAARRGRTDQLADGPGKLCQALGIGLVHDGSHLLDPDGPVRLVPGPAPGAVEATPRIGITKATDRRWRFVARTPVF